jgi:hypothetical protein
MIASASGRWMSVLILLALSSCRDNEMVVPGQAPANANSPTIVTTADAFSFVIEAWQYTQSFSDTLHMGTDSLLVVLVVTGYAGGNGVIELVDRTGYVVMRDSISGNRTIALSLAGHPIPSLFRATFDNLSARVVFSLAKTSPSQDLWKRVWRVSWWIETILPVRNGEVFVGTYDNALYHSSDNGASFASSSGGLSPGDDVHSLASSVDGYLYAGTYGGAFYRSTDNGLTWSRPSNAGGTWFRLHSGDPGEVFAAVFGAGVYRTTRPIY